jgi:uncharacterized protein (TIGR02246 family)
MADIVVFNTTQHAFTRGSPAMRHRIASIAASAIVLAGLTSSAQTVSPAEAKADAQAVRAVLERQAADWNKGDLDAFATGYKDSPDIEFIGTTVHRGYAEMLQTYRTHYGSAAARGTLTFSNLDVHVLDANVATVTGNCHLARTQAGGGDYDCLYSLVLEKTPVGWKIVLDHTTPLTQPKK